MHANCLNAHHIKSLFVSFLVLAVFFYSAEGYALTELEDIKLLQSSIEKDVKALEGNEGQLKSFLEYRILQKTYKIHRNLKHLVERSKADQELLKKPIKDYLFFLNDIEAYYQADMIFILNGLGEGSDEKIMMSFALREKEISALYLANFEALTWGESVGIDVVESKDELRVKLLERADVLDSVLLFTHNKLSTSIAGVNAAGAEPSAELTTQVNSLKERLKINGQSQSSTITLLDSLGEDTAEYKQSMFDISGDITQDVLNLDVVSILLQKWWDIAAIQAMENGPGFTLKLLVFIVIISLTYLLSKAVRKLVTKAVNNSKLKFSVLLQDFFISLSTKVLFALGFLIALSQLGFELAPLLAGFGVAGIVIGFALQDTLSNFASGMMILVYRPFDVGDLINAAGVTGTVSHMSLVSTTVKTLDNQRLIIPNNKIWGDTINNITAEENRRVDMTFGIGYADDIEKTERILNEIIAAHPKVLKDPEPMVKLHNLGDSSVDFIVRPWSRPEDYWDLYWDITREVKMKFDENNITIPFPQQDVHIYKENN